MAIGFRDFTSLPHYPGSDRNKELAEKLKTLWMEQGFEDVKLYMYKIYLSYPQKPAEITLYGGLNKTLKIVNEPSFDESEMQQIFCIHSTLLQKLGVSP